MQETVIWFNGSFLEDTNTRLFDLGSRAIQFGEGLFETILVQNGKIIFASEHLDRLFNSLSFFGWSVSLNKSDFMDTMQQVIEKAEWDFGRLKVMVLCRGELGDLFSTEYRSTDTIFLYSEIRPGGKKKAVRLKTISISGRSDFYSHKLIRYVESSYYLKKAKHKGFDQILYVDERNGVLESSVSNIFFLKGNHLFTPSLELPILPGVTRAKLISLWKELGNKVIEEKIELKCCESFDSCFLTNSTGGIHLVSHLGEFFYNNENEHLSTLDEELKRLFING